MARIRTIKPEAWADEDLGRVSRDARLLFVVLITLADDAGRFRSVPAIVLGHGYAYDNISPKRLEGWMNELTAVGLVELYAVGDVEYGRLPGWDTHQKVDHRKPSTLPEPSANGATGSRGRRESLARRS